MIVQVMLDRLLGATPGQLVFGAVAYALVLSVILSGRRRG